MSGTDIGFDVDDAVKELGRALDDRIDGLRQEGERIIEKLRLAASAREQQIPIEVRGQLGSAPARVVVIEWEGRERIGELELSGWGSQLGQAKLLQPLEQGKRYRAFIVVVPA
jgi:hypothetical protein